MELHLLNLESGRIRKLDSSTVREINDPVFSHDGSWLAYTKHLSLELTAIFLLKLAPDVKGHRLRTGKPVQVTRPVRYDYAPNFDPEGRWLYFLSARVYNPIWDTVQTGTSFSRSIKPYLLTLQEDTFNPFLPQPHPPGSGDSAPDQIERPYHNQIERQHRNRRLHPAQLIEYQPQLRVQETHLFPDRPSIIADHQPYSAS